MIVWWLVIAFLISLVINEWRWQICLLFDWEAVGMLSWCCNHCRHQVLLSYVINNCLVYISWRKLRQQYPVGNGKCLCVCLKCLCHSVCSISFLTQWIGCHSLDVLIFWVSLGSVVNVPLFAQSIMFHVWLLDVFILIQQLFNVLLLESLRWWLLFITCISHHGSTAFIQQFSLQYIVQWQHNNKP